MHGAYIEALTFQRDAQFLHLHLGGGKENDAVEGLVAEHLLDNPVFHAVIAEVSRLLYFLSRLRYGNLHLYGVVEDVLRQFLNVVRHGG